MIFVLHLLWRVGRSIKGGISYQRNKVFLDRVENGAHLPYSLSFWAKIHSPCLYVPREWVETTGVYPVSCSKSAGMAEENKWLDGVVNVIYLTQYLILSSPLFFFLLLGIGHYGGGDLASELGE